MRRRIVVVLVLDDKQSLSCQWKTVCEVVVCGYPEPSSNGIAPDARFLAMRCSVIRTLVITFAASDIVCSLTPPLRLEFILKDGNRLETSFE